MLTRNFFNSVYKKYHSKMLDKKKGFKIKIEQLDKLIYEINSNLDNMYMDKLKGILLEEDYIRYSQKFIFEKTNLIKQKEELEQKLTQTEEKISTKNKRGKRIR